MTTEEKNVLVFKDQAGEFYLLPQEALEQYRVPAEHKAEAARVFAKAGGDDVAGHLGPIGVAIIMAIGVAAWEAGGALADAVKGNDGGAAWLGQQALNTANQFNKPPR